MTHTHTHTRTYIHMILSFREREIFPVDPILPDFRPKLRMGFLSLPYETCPDLNFRYDFVILTIFC